MQEHKSKKIKRIAEVSILVIACGIIVYMLFASFILPYSKYKTANEAFDAGNYEEAYKLFSELGKKEEFSEKIDTKVNGCMDEGEYLEAFELLYAGWTNGWYISKVENEDPSDSMRYARAMMLIESGNYDLAEQWLLAIQGSESERIRELLKHIALSKAYEKAKAMIDQGDYETAYRLLSGLEHKGSIDLLKQITPDYRKSLLSKADAKIGSVITYGAYEQDGDEGNGSEPLEWMVIDTDGSKLFVLSLKVLDDMQFISDTDFRFKVEEGQHITWKNSTIRNWLNTSCFGPPVPAARAEITLFTLTGTEISFFPVSRSTMTTPTDFTSVSVLRCGSTSANKHQKKDCHSRQSFNYDFKRSERVRRPFRGSYNP